MSDIAPIGRPATTYTVNGRAHQTPAPSASPPHRGSDSVQFSSAAQLLGKLRDLPDVRQDLVDRVRGEIAAGTYETPEKLDAAAEAMIDDLA